jgi:hypothetical protein
MSIRTNRNFNYDRVLRTYSQALSAQNATRAIIIGILLITYPSTTKADMMPLRIEWLDVWNVSETTDGQGTYQANTNVEMKTSGNVPTIKAEAQVEGEGSAAAEIHVSRQFRVVLDDAPAVPVRLQGDVAGRKKIDNTWGGDNGEVKFRAKAGVEGTSLQYEFMLHHVNKDVDYSASDTIAVDGTLAANQTYTVTGYAYALGDSDLGLSGHDYRANGTLSLPDPIDITDPIADYYYDVEWQDDWQWSSQGDASGIGTLDLYTDVLGNLVGGGLWGSIVNYGLDAYFEASSTAEKIEGHFLPADGESYVYARGRFGGHAWINIESERDFSLVPVTDALAQLRFDGILMGDLFSEGTSSAVSLTEVSINGSGLNWSMGKSVSNGESTSVQENITACGLAVLNQIYTYEGLFSLNSQASASSLAYADFLSSFEGELSVVSVPIPGSAVLGIIGMVSAAGILRKRKGKMLRIGSLGNTGNTRDSHEWRSLV